MEQPLTVMTKAVAVALDIAGRPETDDVFALNSVRKAYRMLNGGTFQNVVSHQQKPSQVTDYGIDWSAAYRLEAMKTEALTRQLDALRAELAERLVSPPSSPGPSATRGPCRPQGDCDQPRRIERTRAEIIAVLRRGDHTVSDICQITNIHLRTVQRRLRELVLDRIVRQATDGISPSYQLTS